MEGITYPISANSGVILIQEQLPNQVSISGSSESSRLEAGKLLSRILSASSWSYSFDLEEELCNSIPIEMREEEMELQRLQMVIEDQKKAKSIQLEIAEASRRKREEEIRMQEEREFKLLEQEKERIRLLEEAREKEIAASRRQKIFAGLSPDQVEALNEFQAISGAELEVCSCYLVHHQWDKINAVNSFLETEGDVSKLIPSPEVRKSEDVRITVVFPDFFREQKSFNGDDTLWSVYQFVLTKAEKWGNSPFMIGNAKRLYTEEELDKEIKDADLAPTWTIFVKKY